MSEEILDYATLLDRYETGLIETLRSFGFQTEYLDLWVPDEDISRSLLNLFDAAAEGGRTSLAVRVPIAWVDTLKKAGFPDVAAQRGALSVESADSSAILRMTDLRVAETSSAQRSSGPLQSGNTASSGTVQIAPEAAREPLRQPQGLSEPYATNLRAAQPDVRPAPPAADTVQVQAEVDGLVLKAAIDPVTHCIRQMTQTGAREQCAHDLVAFLTRICLGLPILEAADHGSIRLEHLLRGDAPRPRQGIMIAEMAEPGFRFTTALLRDLLADYRRKVGFSDVSNTFDIPPGPGWMLADEAARRRQLQQAFSRGGFGSEAVNVVAIEYDVRVVVSLSGDLAKDAAGAVVSLERCIKKHLDNRLELFLTEVNDSNKLRRLSEPSGKAS